MHRQTPGGDRVAQRCAGRHPRQAKQHSKGLTGATLEFTGNREQSLLLPVTVENFLILRALDKVLRRLLPQAGSKSALV